MNVEKHESSLLKVVSDVGSTPTASTISYPIDYQYLTRLPGDLSPRLRAFVLLCDRDVRAKL